MKNFKDYLKIITESNQNNYYIEYDRILKIKPSYDDLKNILKKTQEIIDKINKDRKEEDELKIIKDEDLHITILHQNYAKPLKENFENIEINDLNEINFEEQLYLIKDGDKESIFAVVKKIDQEKIEKAFDYKKFEANRILHISLANKIGARSGSVGHSESKPLEPSEKLKIGN